MKQATQNKYTQMTTAPIPSLIGKLAIPTIVSMLITSFYVMADTYFVGKINTQSTAAVGISFSIMAIIQAFGFFFGHGSGNYISRKLGAQDYKSAEKMASTGFFYAFFAGILIMVLGLIFLRPICLALGSTPTILPYAEQYLGIILLGAPFMASSLVLNNQMRFQGNAVYAMVGIIVGAVLNIGLDPLLIFVFDMGIAGAAWATFTSQISSFLILLYMDSKGENIRIHFRNFDSAECCSRGLWRCSHCRNVHCYKNLHVHQFFCHRIWTRFSTSMRFQLWCRTIQTGSGRILVCRQDRSHFSDFLCHCRLHLCSRNRSVVPKRRSTGHRNRST